MTVSIRRRPLKLAGIVAASMICLGLGACGGGGGGGSGVTSTPPPPPAPPPPPPPPGTPGIITAPAAGTVAAGMSPVVASQGGPNFTSGTASGTVFPLLQTTLVIDSGGIDADPEANAAGGTATVQGSELSVNLLHTHAGLAGTHGFAGDVQAWGDPNLDWTRAGYWSTGGVWDYHESPLTHRGVFVTGYETSAGAMPTTGTATYSGSAQGSVFYPATDSSGAIACNCGEVLIGGKASFTADFGARTLAGSLTEMWAGGDPWFDDPDGGSWNDVAFSSTIAGNGFSGTASVTSAPGGLYSLGAGATGTVEGRFFGPAAQEAGAVWTLFDGTKSAIGTLTVKRN